MMKWNLYSRGDKFFAIVVSILIGMFTVATLYPFIYIAAVSFSSGFAAQAGKVVFAPIDATVEVILLRNFFEAIPRSFEEAARMDGANDFQVLWKVFVPLSKPAIATITLFCIVSRWNGFFWAMVLLQSEEKIPLQVFLRHTIANLSDDDEFAIVQTAAGFSAETVTAAIIVCSIIPVLIVYPFIQKYFEKGILLGGVKE